MSNLTITEDDLDEVQSITLYLTNMGKGKWASVVQRLADGFEVQNEAIDEDARIVSQLQKEKDVLNGKVEVIMDFLCDDCRETVKENLAKKGL